MSSPSSDDAIDAELLGLFAKLADPEQRVAGAAALAARLGGSDLIVFLHDPEVGIALPAPGFPQTLPGGREWRHFLARCAEAGEQSGELPWHEGRTVASGVAADGIVLVVIGDASRLPQLRRIRPVLSLVAAGLLGERTAHHTEVQARQAREAAAQASQMAAALDAVRAELQRALQRAEEAHQQVEAQATELEAANEELQSQATWLEESQAELEVAYDELQRTNAELAEQRETAERAQRAAEEANRAKSIFLANMSHELRTPINAIVGYTELTEMGISGPLTEAQRRNLERTRASSQHLLGLVNEVLDLAKVESGQLLMEQDRFAVAETVGAALNLIGPQASQREVEIRDGVSGQATLTYHGDADRVRQILVNLLSNAVKFTEPGGCVAIACTAEERPDRNAHLPGSGPWLRIDVEDTGAGIPQEQLRRIFEPFFQVKGGYTRESGGTGLGLTISRQLARMMSGDLTVRSRLGEGSCFSLWLPVASKWTREEKDRRIWPGAPLEVPRLAEVGRTLARCAEDVVEDTIDRLRDDRATPGAKQLDRAQLEDHTATFLVDIGLSMVALDEGGGEPALMQDGTEIQRVIAERHGAQRARLGWPEEALPREFEILRGIVESTLRRELPMEAEESVDEAMAVLHRLLEQAERISVRGFRGAAE